MVKSNFILFCGDIYYAGGGANDIGGYFSSKSSAEEQGNQWLISNKIEWWHVFDLETLEIVSRSEGLPYS